MVRRGPLREAGLDGRRSVTITTTLGWSGALGESVGAWFGARHVWAPNERRADGDITDHRPPHAFAPRTTVGSGVKDIVAP
jgi:hypothetical protein